jgi:hypothetical protein
MIFSICLVSLLEQPELILDVYNDSANQKRMNVAEITCSASNLNEEDED